VEELLDYRSKVGLLVNHSLHKKSGSMIIKKYIILLEGTYTFEDRRESGLPHRYASFLKINWQCVRDIQYSKVQNNSILGNDGIE
jgi:hypothetical protein